MEIRGEGQSSLKTNDGKLEGPSVAVNGHSKRKIEAFIN